MPDEVMIEPPPRDRDARPRICRPDGRCWRGSIGRRGAGRFRRWSRCMAAPGPRATGSTTRRSTRRWRKAASSCSRSISACRREHRYPASIADINYATRWLKAHAARVRQPARPRRRARHVERRAQLLLSCAEAEGPALRRVAARRGAGRGRELALSGAVLADLRPARALSHGQGKGQHADRQVARRLLGLGSRDGARGTRSASSRAARRRPCRRRSSCRAPATTT